MSEAPDQPVGAEAPAAAVAPGVEAAAPAATTTTDDDIETEAFDRTDAPPEDAEEAPEGQSEGGGDPDKPTPDAEPDVIEVEAAGEKFKVPAALKPVLLMQEDYTKKTQAVAEERRALDAKAEELALKESQQAESLKQFRAEHIAVGQYERGIADIDTKLGEYAKLTPEQWAGFRAENLEQYEAHRANRQALRDTRADYADALGKAQEDLKGKEAKLTADQQAAQGESLAKAWRETNATLAKEIKDWSPAKGQELGKMMSERFGVSPEELRETTDPRVWIMADKVLHLEAENTRLKTGQKQIAATSEALRSQTVTPAARPSGGGAKPTGVSDKLSTEEWLRRRNAQVARKAAGR